ncbi:MAG TPA: hypothetical protein VGN81_32820 [Pseudonocardiaceae bacterium]
MQVKRFEEVGQEVDQAGQGQVGAGRHRDAVGAQGQDRPEVGEAGGQRRQHAIPQGVVHQQAVQQHDRRAGADLVILDGSCWQCHGSHLTPLARTFSLERLF